MKIKMNEFFQGTGQPNLEKGKEYQSSEIGKGLVEWLLEHKKAVVVEEPKAPEPAQVEEPKEEAQEPLKQVRSTRRRSAKK